MEKYIALLRGVNVGGKNRLSMGELKELLEQNGFSGVVTYINSGNIIFSHDSADVSALGRACEALIADRFGLSIPVMLISADELAAALAGAPAWWGRDRDSKHNAIFVVPPTTVEEVFAEVGAIRPEYEQVAHCGRVIFWSAPLETFSKTRWSGVVGSSVYGRITIRNANTVRKLLQLATKEDKA